MRNVRLIVGAVGLWSLAASAQEAALLPLVEWAADAEVSTAIGYRNNVLRSSIADENSSFVLTTFDASLMRMNSSGAFLMAYIFGEDTRYFDAPTVNYEQFLSGAVHGALPVGSNDELNLILNYLYQHQIIDASETEVNQRRVLVLGHSAAVRSGWEHRFSSQWETRIQAGGLRQIYEQELDDFSEADVMLRLVRKYGHRSELRVGLQTLQRFYDTREQYDEQGFVVQGTDLVYLQNELSAESLHYWDAARHWRSVSRFSCMLNRDNGSGYFDYDRYLFREQLRWDNGKWTAKGTARIGWYFYKMQVVLNEKRERSYAALDFRIERRIGTHWKIHMAAEKEWNVSNAPLDDYESWMVNAGVGLIF